MAVHSSQISGTVRLLDVLISLVILAGTTWLFVARLQSEREADELANAQNEGNGDATEKFTPDPEPVDEPVKIAKPAKVSPKPVAKPKPSQPAPADTSAQTSSGYQPRSYTPRGYQPRGFNRRGFNPR